MTERRARRAARRPPAAGLRFSAAFVLAAVLALAGCGERPEPLKAAAGDGIGDVALPDLMNGHVVALAGYRGRPLVVNVWATWCEPCREEMPSLERLREAAQPHGIAVVGISVDSDLNLAREFVLRRRLYFANLSDPGMALGRSRLGIRALPETLVIDRDGKIVMRVVGARDWSGGEARALLGTAFGVDLSTQ